MSKKIVIIGAGPIGCYTAQLLKIYGYQPLLIEEHHDVGRPIHCTGLVGERVFSEKRPFPLPSKAILNVINGAVIHYDSQSFSITRKKVAYVLNREEFDKELSQGLNILYGNKFLGLEKVKSRYIIETNRSQLFSDIVIGADGANSLVRKILNPDTNNIHNYKGIQVRIKARPRYQDMVEVYLVRPSFFWVVPETKDIIRVGTISEHPYSDLQTFLKETKLKGRILERFGGLVSLGICPHTVKENIALVGDAACQLKPLSYGGIYFGLKAASILTSCIKENHLADYDRLWKRELSLEIKIGLKVKNIYRRLEKEDFKKIFRLLKVHKSLIEQVGDFENHGRLILEMIKRPVFYSQISEILQIFFKNIA